MIAACGFLDQGEIVYRSELNAAAMELRGVGWFLSRPNRSETVPCDV